MSAGAKQARAASKTPQLKKLLFCETLRKSTVWLAAEVNGMWWFFPTEESIFQYCKDHKLEPIRDDAIHPRFPNNKESCVVNHIPGGDDDEDTF